MASPTPAPRRLSALEAAPVVIPDADRESAFEAAFNDHYVRVYGVLFRLLGDRDEAHDLALETFWRLWQRAPRQAGNLAGWLYRVATRLGYNALRAGRRRARYEIEAGIASLEAAAAPDPAAAAQLAEERAQVRAVLQRMPLRDAQLLILRHSGLSYKELAAALDLAPGSIGTLLSRAEAAFERLYAS